MLVLRLLSLRVRPLWHRARRPRFAPQACFQASVKRGQYDFGYCTTCACIQHVHDTSMMAVGNLVGKLVISRCRVPTCQAQGDIIIVRFWCLLTYYSNIQSYLLAYKVFLTAPKLRTALLA